MESFFLKGLGARLTHKTERGWVRLNLRNRREVLAAAKAIEKSAGEDLEGYLVQPMVLGRREFVAGLFCDPQFGPIVMFGLGGIFTEALGERLRIAPRIKRGRMMLASFALEVAWTFRENRGPERGGLRTLVGLSRLARTLRRQGSRYQPPRVRS